jgi:aspartate aminotransferase
MFTQLQPSGANPLQLAIEACAADHRKHKIDLLVGMYRDERGRTPVMRAVRLAEERLARAQETKGYLSVIGRESFVATLLELVLGTGEVRSRASAVQTVGGSGALKLLLDLVRRLNPTANIWLSDPGYLGHYAIARGVGLRLRHYPYIVAPDGVLCADPILQAIASAPPGDVIVLDAACHNPTGVDASAEVWAEIGRICRARRLLPLIDVAYQGLARDCVAESERVTNLLAELDYGMVAVSCSKTFGVYRERAGIAIMIGPTRAAVGKAIQSLVEIAFAAYTVPPDHGAALVDTVLNDAALRSMWQEELAQMRRRLRELRVRFAATIARIVGEADVEHIRRGNGMFSMLPLSAEEMCELREKFAVYGLLNGRVNITGMSADQVQAVGEAVAFVLSGPRPS